VAKVVRSEFEIKESFMKQLSFGHEWSNKSAPFAEKIAFDVPDLSCTLKVVREFLGVGVV